MRKPINTVVNCVAPPDTALFSVFDADGDGTVDVAEERPVRLTLLGATVEVVRLVLPEQP